MSKTVDTVGESPSDGTSRRAWLVLFCSYTAIFTHSIVLFGQGVLFLQLLEKFDEGEAKTSMVGSANPAVFCFSAVLASIFINVSSCRVVIMTGSVIHVTGLVLSAFVPNIGLMILTMGGLAGLGNSLVNGGSTCVVGYYFRRHSDTFVSISFVMLGVALCAAAPLMVLLTEYFSFEEICFILASINIHGCVWGALSSPSKLEKEVRSKRRKEKQLEKLQDEYSPTFRWKSCFDFSLLLNKSFSLYMLSLTTWNFAFMMAVVHLPNFIVKLGGTDKDISLLMLSFAIANASGRALGTLVVNKLSRHLLFVQNVSLGVSGLLTASFSMYGHLPGAPYFFAIQLGLFIGIPNTMMTPLCNQFVGLSKISESYGFVHVFCGIGIATGPSVAGVLFSAVGSYRSSFIVAGCTLVIGCILGFLAHYFKGDNSQGLPVYDISVVKKDGELVTLTDVKNDNGCEETTFIPNGKLSKECS